MVNTRSTIRGDSDHSRMEAGTSQGLLGSTTQPAATLTTQTITTTTTAAASNAPIASAFSSIASPLPPGMDDLSRLLSSTFSSQGHVSSPTFSPLTGLHVPVPPADPAMSVAMRQIISSAVGLARVEFERDQARTMSRLIPTIVEATRQSLGVGNSVPTSSATMAQMTAGQPGRPLLGQGQHMSLGQMQTHPGRGLPQTQPPVAPYQRAEALYSQPPPFVPGSGISAVPPPSIPTQPVPQAGGLGLPSVYRNSWGSGRPDGYTPFAERPPPHQANTREPPPHPPPSVQQTHFPGSSSHFGRPGGSTRSESTGKLNLAKWGVKFDGTTKTMNVHEFIFRVGELKRDYECPDEDFITKFHQLLESPALDWYWGHRKFVQFRDWNELQTALLNQYQRFENEFQVQTQMLNRRQLPHESFEDFYNAVMQLRTQQKAPYSENEMVEIMRGNLKSSLAQMIFSARISNLGEFYREVKRAENLIASHRQQYSRPGPPQRVHELAWEEALPPEILEVDAIQDRTKIKCWNCEAEGHSWVDCAAPRKYFCYRCGHAGVTVANCPKCQGNRPRGSPHTGGVRSTPV
uniref:CCHC-type domain-containing protein n=1 Tax=Stomoxys calcitrans TaxID=35570 RepID=A0A1I8PBB0_STOCA